MYLSPSISSKPHITFMFWQNLLHLSSSYLMQIMQLIYDCLRLNQIQYHKSLNQPRILDLGIYTTFYLGLIDKFFFTISLTIISTILFLHLFFHECMICTAPANNIYMWPLIHEFSFQQFHLTLVQSHQCVYVLLVCMVDYPSLRAVPEPEPAPEEPILESNTI